MKLQVGEKVYLQVYDLIFIVFELSEYPGSILKEAFSDDDGNALLAMDDEAEKLFWFKYVFQEPESVEWLMAQDWIVDYDDYAEASVPELDMKVHLCDKGLAARVELFMGGADEKEFIEICKIEHKLTSLVAFRTFLEGKLAFRFPVGFYGPHKKRFSFWAWLLGKE